MAKSQKKFEIRYDEGLCKRCGICVAFCPKECLGQDELGKVNVIDEKKCAGCLLCMIRCPDMAIEVVEKEKNQISH